MFDSRIGMLPTGVGQVVNLQADCQIGPYIGFVYAIEVTLWQQSDNLRQIAATNALKRGLRARTFFWPPQSHFALLRSAFHPP